MNEKMNIEETLKNRRSYRNYTNQKVDLDIVKNAIISAQRSATSVNGQQISVVITEDQDKLNKMSDINWGQKTLKECSVLLTFVVDYNRSDEMVEDGKMIHQDDIESVIVGAVDAGLVAQSVELILQSKKIGTCMIGGIRQDMKKVSEVLGITGLAFPVFSMTVGYPKEFMNKEDDIRPRVNKDSFLFIDQYNEQKVRDGAQEYNLNLNKWWEKRGYTEYNTYKDSMNRFYSSYYLPNEFSELLEMGFLSKYEEKNRRN